MPFCTSEKRAYRTLVLSFCFSWLVLCGNRWLGFDGAILHRIDPHAFTHVQTFYLRPGVYRIFGPEPAYAPIGTGPRLATRWDVHLSIGTRTAPAGELSPVTVFEGRYN
jgi:hypothetical protein